MPRYFEGLSVGEGRDLGSVAPRKRLGRAAASPVMRIEYDRDTCIGMFQCVDEWDGFEKDLDAGKATLVEGEERDGVFVREVPEAEAFEAEMAARVCPVDAIALYDDDGERVVP